MGLRPLVLISQSLKRPGTLKKITKLAIHPQFGRIISQFYPKSKDLNWSRRKDKDPLSETLEIILKNESTFDNFSSKNIPGFETTSTPQDSRQEDLDSQKPPTIVPVISRIKVNYDFFTLKNGLCGINFRKFSQGAKIDGLFFGKLTQKLLRFRNSIFIS